MLVEKLRVHRKQRKDESPTHVYTESSLCPFSTRKVVGEQNGYFNIRTSFVSLINV